MRLHSPMQQLAIGSSPKSYFGEGPASSAPPHHFSKVPPTGQASMSVEYDTLLSELLNKPQITGAAIAVAVNDYLECVASRGPSAPSVGSRCYPGVGLTGL